MKKLSLLILLVAAPLVMPAETRAAADTVPVVEKIQATAAKWKKYVLKGCDNLEDVMHTTLTGDVLKERNAKALSGQPGGVDENLLRNMEEMTYYMGENKKFLRKLSDANKRLAKFPGYSRRSGLQEGGNEVNVYTYTEGDLIREVIVVCIFDGEFGMFTQLVGSFTEADLPELFKGMNVSLK